MKVRILKNYTFFCGSAHFLGQNCTKVYKTIPPPTNYEQFTEMR
jgi:hypothetical protein